MDILEFLIPAAVALLILATAITLAVLTIIAWVRSRRLGELTRRIERLERRLEQLLASGAPAADITAGVPSPSAQPLAPPSPEQRLAGVERPPPIVTAATVEAKVVSGAEVAAAGAEPIGQPINWELLIGRRALGWVAIVVLLFATGFFLRYAYENQWIGPLGRVMIGISAGLGLVVGGWQYERRRMRLFSRMLTSGGIMLLYLTTFSAFGFYHLVPQHLAGVFLVILVAEAALLALGYDSAAIAVMALVGGLVTPLLMQSDHDQYVSLFTYLSILTAGSLALLVVRAWPVIGTLALVGVQGVYWGWYFDNYHPEKLAWALGFQAVVFTLHWGQAVLSSRLRQQPSTWEEAIRSSFNAGLAFLAFYVLLADQHEDWHGLLAVSLAGVYALTGRILLSRPVESGRMLLAAIGISVGFIALAFPLQASAHWIALGWAAQAAILWWFGLRVNQVPARVFAMVLAALACGRLVFVDTPEDAIFASATFTPIFNDYATPALATVSCLLVALALTRTRITRLPLLERGLAAFGLVTCLLLVWFIVSVDLYQYFQTQADFGSWTGDWRRWAGMSLSAWWAVYATAILSLGFVIRMGLLRWTALGLYAVTIGKLFLWDMAGLDQIYRIVAFLVLAVFLGVAAWAYQHWQGGGTEK